MFHVEHPEAWLLADTELGENFAEQIVRGEFTGDRTQGFMGQPKFFRIQLQVASLCRRLREVALSGLQGCHMPRPGGE